MTDRRAPGHPEPNRGPRVLVVGLGSIGQRHLRNLRTLLGDSADLLACRVRHLPHVITDQLTIDPTRTIEDAYGVRVFDGLDAALAEAPDAVFVCNPTSEHLATARAAVGAGAHVFIEKPVSHRDDGVALLASQAEASGRVVAVGYQLRQHPALQYVRELLCRKAIGRVISVRAEMGEYLPDAHPYEDYRQSYAARADLGGGVILCFIHELDYLCWFFGMPTRVFTTGGRLGELEIDVEDTALSTLEYEVDGRAVPVQVHHTFLQRVPSRGCVIVGEAGRITVDLIASRVVLQANGVTAARDFELQRNDLFLAEARHFLAAIAGVDAPIVTLRDGLLSLRVALAARRSLATGEVVAL